MKHTIAVRFFARARALWLVVFAVSAYMLFCSAHTFKQENRARPESKAIHNYDIRISGIRVGHLIATREIKDEATTYHLTSEASVFLGFTYHFKEDLTVIYRNNFMQSALIQSSVGKKNYSSTIAWNKDHYDVNINAYHYTRKAIESSPAEFSAARLYFEEPPAGVKIFSEDYGLFSDLPVSGTHPIELFFGGYKNRYYYSAGEMVKTEVHHSIKDFVVVLK